MRFNYKLRLCIWLITTTLSFFIFNFNLLAKIGVGGSETSPAFQVISILITILVFSLLQYVYLWYFEKVSIKWFIGLFFMGFSILLLFILMNGVIIPKLGDIFQITSIVAWPFAGFAIASKISYSGNLLVSILIGFIHGSINGGVITLFYSFLTKNNYLLKNGLLVLFVMILIGSTINSIVLSNDLYVNNIYNYKVLVRCCVAFLGLLYGISTARLNLSRDKRSSINLDPVSFTPKEENE